MRNRELTTEQIRHVNLYAGYLAEFLRAEREALGISPEKLSEKAGLDSKTFRRIENCEFTPNYSSLLLIARALGYTPERFFRKFTRYLEGREVRERRQLLGRYYSKDKSECVEVWRILG